MIFEEKIKALIRDFEQLPDLIDVVTDIEMEEQFPKLVRKQLSFGENSDSEDIQIGYSFMWGSRRAEEGLQTDFVDLNFTGNFYKSLETMEVGDEYFLDSIVPYASEINDRYPKILGLQEDNLNLIVNNIKKEIVKNFRDA